MELPIACSLEATAVEERGGRWRALAGRALIDQRATERGVLQRYRLDDEVEAELRELAALERDCCGFARWEVRASDGALELEVSSAGDGARAVQEMFNA